MINGTMIKGTVKFYNAERGFGYIKPDDSEKDVRILLSALSRADIKSLTQGQKVKFDTHTDPDSGKVAVHNIEVD
ncbi:cold-shock protein [Kiloniella majae]|uniref:cold-shock protein n=1 Tax=Kiloniella majae TaxID=1938558 RepID=UPI001FEC971E|nr:cold shock domain-containing protein [Kiloniella majae]